jgi:hypothetical protein
MKSLSFCLSEKDLYFIDYVLIFESHYSPKKKLLNEFEWYAGSDESWPIK